MNGRFLRISNYRQYQHYKDRNPAWVKQHREFWTNYDMSTHKTSTRLLALFLISYASEFKTEHIPCNFGEISKRSSLNKVQVKYGIEQLLLSGFLSETASEPLAPRYQDATALAKSKRTEEEIEKELVGWRNTYPYPAKEQP